MQLSHFCSEMCQSFPSKSKHNSIPYVYIRINYNMHMNYMLLCYKYNNANGVHVLLVTYYFTHPTTTQNTTSI